MVKLRWTYSSPRGLTQWYGHVDYHGPYVIGQWFSLDAETGGELWSRRFLRPNTVRGVSCDVIIASETRSDGPWTFDFGIYGIHARTGERLWTNHGRGAAGRLLRLLDLVPGFTNEFRDAPEKVVGDKLLTRRRRVLDVRTGRELTGAEVELVGEGEGREALPAWELYHRGLLRLDDGDTLQVERDVEGVETSILIRRVDPGGKERWRFSPRARSLHVGSDYYSYRLHAGSIYAVAGNAPRCVPAGPRRARPNPADYQLAILDVASGDCALHPMEHARGRTECRIEAVRDRRLLVSCDGTLLMEYDTAGDP